MRLLIVDDEASLRRTLRLTLASMGHQVSEAVDGASACSILQTERWDIIFLDLRLTRESGLDLLPQLLRIAPDAGVIVMTAYAAIDTAVEAMRRGAFDYLPKPFTPDQLRLVLDRWRELKLMRSEIHDLRERVRSATPEMELESEDRNVRAAIEVAERVAPTDAAVMIRGESGTGKGVLARTIHARSKRHRHPFITVHCPSLSSELLESELFGHVRGAFTGAVESTEGKVAVADTGTLFLDEIGDLPAQLQPKLLRFLQDKTYERVGDTRTRTADVRIIAATNRPLEAEVQAGRFREDLLYRLNVIEITMPPLRDRPMDLPRLANHLLQAFAKQSNKVIHRFTTEALAAIQRHPWPGNVRELRNVIERAVILTNDDEIGLSLLPDQIIAPKPGLVQLGARVTLETIETEHIRRVLATTTSLDEAATILGIDASTLYRKRRRFGL